MSISFQTNYASLVAQNNLTMNNVAQTSTIESLTSGYRINNSGDDPAGLAVANQFRDSVAQLNQGVINANTAGESLLLNVAGGLTNKGLVEATGGGILHIQDTVNNAAGSITTDNASVAYLDTGATI